MKNKNESKCIEPGTGNLIIQYELGLLDAQDRDCFEDHLMDCEFCRIELEQMMPATQFLKQHRSEIKNALQLEEEKTEIVEQAILSKRGENKMIKSLAQLIGNLVETVTKPRIYAPALAVTATIVFCIVIFIKDFTGNPYADFLSYEPLQYRQMTLRGDIHSNAERLFDVGMTAYAISNYKQAIKGLELAVAESSDSWKYWMYLGISYYLDHRPPEAINALTKADKLSKYAFKDEIRWYLYQSLLLNKDNVRADSLHNVLMSRGGKYASIAESQRTRINDFQKKERSENLALGVVYFFILTVLLIAWRKQSPC